MESNRFMTCQLKVDTQSAGWHKTMTKILSSIKGVSYSIDVERGVANVRGNIDPESMLKLLSKAGKHAELLWLDSGSAAPPPDLPVSPTHSLLLPHHAYRYGNYHPEFAADHMQPTAADHYPVFYQPAPARDLHGFPRLPSPAKVYPHSTCSIM